VKADVVARSVPDVHLQDDLALVGELDRVPHEIEDDLPQSAGVTLQHVGDVRSDIIGKLQPLGVGADGHGLQGVAQTIAQQEIDGIELELARLDLREIENVIDDGEESVGRRLDREQVFSSRASNRAEFVTPSRLRTLSVIRSATSMTSNDWEMSRPTSASPSAASRRRSDSWKRRWRSTLLV
jgi:hypothetical protein